MAGRYCLTSCNTNGSVFLAQNRDGLGERLRAIANAMVAAETFDGQFRFVWPELRAELVSAHAVLSADEFFSESFCAAHLLPEEHLKILSPEPLSEVTGDLAAGRLPEETAISVAQLDLCDQAPELFSRQTARFDLVAAFARISLTEPMEFARSLAYQVELPPEAAAIHLRAGDVIYGIYRHMDEFHHKVLAYPLAIELIARLKAQGIAPLLFGQDSELLHHLRDDYGALLADDFGERADFTQTQNALFDICLLARCRRIYSANSGFAILGSWLACTEIEHPSRIFPADEAVQIIERHVLDPDATSAISKMQKAFAARSAFVIAGETVATREPFWRLLKAARSFDPQNALLQFVYACSLYRAGKASEADQVLWTVFQWAPADRWRLIWFLRGMSPRSKNAHAEPYLEGLTQKAREGHPMAAFCCAIVFDSLGRDAAAAEMVALFGENACPSMLGLAALLPAGNAKSGSTV